MIDGGLIFIGDDRGFRKVKPVVLVHKFQLQLVNDSGFISVDYFNRFLGLSTIKAHYTCMVMILLNRVVWRGDKQMNISQ
jgi:hypothetical protein